MSASRDRSLQRLAGVQALAIVLTVSLLEWLRALPTRRALHMLKLIAEVLRKHGETAWPARLQAMAEHLRAALDSGSPERLMDAMQAILVFFDGAGSLSDFRLSPENGHKIKPPEVEAVNARLGALKTQLRLSSRQTIARVQWNSRRSMRYSAHPVTRF